MGLVLLGILAAVPQARDARLAEAIHRYESAKFAPARDGLLELVDAPGLTDVDRADVRTYLAACYLALGDKGSAKLQLRELEREQPEARPSPATFAPDLIAMANDVWVEGALKRASVLPAPPPLVEPTPVLMPERQPPPSRGWAFLGFGIGQFRLGNTVQGAVLLGVEALCFLISGVTLGVLESRKLPEDRAFLTRGRFTDVQGAQSLNTIYSVTFFTGLAVVLGELIKANVTWPTGDVP